MNQNPRTRLLRRARVATAAIGVAAVVGTAALTAAAADATPQGGTDRTGSGGVPDDGDGSFPGSQWWSFDDPPGSGSGLTQVPQGSGSHGGTNAS